MAGATEIEKALERLIECVNHDMNGVPGMPMSGNGGLLSDATMKAADEARLALYRYRARRAKGQ